MDDLPLPQEADGCDDIGVIDETKDVIVGSAGFLLGGHVLAQVGDGITSGLHGGRGEGHAAGGLRPDANGVIDEVGCEAGIFDLFDGEIPGELVDDGADHLQMSQLLGANIIEETGDPAVGHGKFLRKVAQAGAQFAIGSAVLAYDDLCGLGVGALDIDREFQNLIIVPHIQPSQGQGVQPQLQLRLPAAAQGVSGAASL